LSFATAKSRKSTQTGTSRSRLARLRCRAQHPLR
jgi:hypothetical protein